MRVFGKHSCMSSPFPIAIEWYLIFSQNNMIIQHVPVFVLKCDVRGRELGDVFALPSLYLGTNGAATSTGSSRGSVNCYTQLIHLAESQRICSYSEIDIRL